MTSDEELTQAVTKFAISRLDIDLLGIAPVERLQGAPKGRRPTDYLSNAGSVVVCAVKIPDAVIDVAGRYDDAGKTLSPYMWYGYVIANWNLSSAANRLVRFLESKGFKALPFPPTGLLYKYGTVADFSHRHAAVAAGLGELGFSGLLLSPQFGPRQRLVSVITDAPLKPSSMYEGIRLCQPDHCGYACLKACPTTAMRGKQSVTIDARKFEHAGLHPVKCKWLYPEKGFRRTKIPIPRDPTDDDWQEALRSAKIHPFDAALNQFTFVPHCGACIFSCPSPHF